MKKRPYRAISVKEVDRTMIRQRLEGQRVIVGIDVAKVDFVATLMGEDSETVVTLKWKHPTETREFVQLLKDVSASRLEAALEPTGSYGDALMGQLRQQGVEIFLVSAKRVHDAIEFFDGVPSSHDAKSAMIIAKLHLSGASRAWRVRTEKERELAAALKTMDMYREQYQSHISRLEAILATYWPEVTSILELDSTTLQILIVTFGSAQQVATHSQEAYELMQSFGGSMLREEKIQAVIDCAKQTQGIAPINAELLALKEQASDMQRCKKALLQARAQVEKLSRTYEATQSIAPVIGKVTAAVLINEVGDPISFPAAAIFTKAAGLNLKERSSGKHKGKLKITKRGSSMIRKYLYLAALRLVQHDPIIAAWYKRKVDRDGGICRKALVAIMRKLTKALWHVRRGEVFDSKKLFNTSRLTIASASK